MITVKHKIQNRKLLILQGIFFPLSALLHLLLTVRSVKVKVIIITKGRTKVELYSNRKPSLSYLS